ncbi:MAG: peptidase M20 [Acidovorax sp. 17-64-282]|nr:MAG: peptidase M20 [Acidovorax sp. 17-64-282]
MTTPTQASYTALDAWIDQHFDEEVRFLQALVRVSTDTPPGNNAPHAERTAELLQDFGYTAEKHAVPAADVQAYGMESITNLIVRRPYGQGGKTIALNAHGDVVWLLQKGLTKPDLMIAAGFSYEVVTAHNGCLQMEVTVHGKMAHAAVPHTGVDALQGAVHILNALYAQNDGYKKVTSKIEGIQHPYLNVGRIEGGTNTNVVPGKVSFKLDRRMIPEENPVEVEATIRRVIEQAAGERAGISVDIKRLLLANAMTPLAGNAPLVAAIQKHAQAVIGEPVPAVGTPLYTDVRLYGERGIPGVIYGAGPRTVLESHAKRADERLDLEDLRRATKVIARTLSDLLA